MDALNWFTLFLCLWLIVYNLFRIYAVEKKYPVCPHGFEDWDECPECCH